MKFSLADVKIQIASKLGSPPRLKVAKGAVAVELKDP